MRRIFISYRRDDSKSVASRLYDRLAEIFGKHNIFKDVNVIPPGVDFRQFIQDEIAKTDVVLVIIGTRWQRILSERAQDPRDFVRLEIESAFQQHKLVIPVLVEGANPPREDDLPESIRKLAFINSARVDDDPDFHPDVDRLIAQLMPTRPASRGPRLRAGLLALGTILALGAGALGIAAGVLPGLASPQAAQNANATATARALPTLGPQAPSVSGFGAMWLLNEPSERALIVGSISSAAPIVGRDPSGEYLLVLADSRYGWVRRNNFTRVTGSGENIPVVFYTAPTSTPAPDITATPRPSPTPRPTSVYAEGWLVNATARFTTGLPSGWAVTNGDFPVAAQGGSLLMAGRGSSDDAVRRSGFFANSGTTTVFRLIPDESGFYEARLYLTQGLPGQPGYREFGIRPLSGTTWQIVSAQDSSSPRVAGEFLLLPERAYELTILLEGNRTFFVTLVDQETGERVLDNKQVQMSAEWNARVGDPIFWVMNPLTGTTQVERVDTLLKAR